MKTNGSFSFSAAETIAQDEDNQSSLKMVTWDKRQTFETSRGPFQQQYQVNITGWMVSMHIVSPAKFDDHYQYFWRDGICKLFTALSGISEESRPRFQGRHKTLLVLL